MKKKAKLIEISSESKSYYIISLDDFKEGEEYNDLVANNVDGNWVVFKTTRLFPQFKEVLATPEQIGWHFIKGHLHHDHAKPYGKNTLEEIHPETIRKILNNGGNCEIEVEEKWQRVGGPAVKGKLMSYGKKWTEPVLNDNKVIIYT